MRIILTGKSGVGKSTLQQWIHENMGMPKLILTTTRSPRFGEKDGKDFIFVSANHYSSAMRKDLFPIHTIFKDNFYGCHTNDFTENCVAVLEALMVKQAQDFFADTVVFKLELPEEVRIARLTERGTIITSQDEERYDNVHVNFALSTEGTRLDVFNEFKMLLSKIPHPLLT